MWGVWSLRKNLRDFWGFPGSSADKEFSCSAGDPGLIPGLGRSPGEGGRKQSDRTEQLSLFTELLSEDTQKAVGDTGLELRRKRMIQK